MKGDFSKWRFDKHDNYSGVLHQQGRVLLDADWNAQTRITGHWRDTAARDTIGPGVAAVPVDDRDAFKVINAEVVGGQVRLTILPGRIWADGLLLHLEAPEALVEVELLADYLVSHGPQPDPPTLPGQRDAVILEVWREAVSGFQEYDRLLEPALGGPDTTERMRTAMALRLLTLDATEGCRNIRHLLENRFNTTGRLTVTLAPEGDTGETCPRYDTGGYSGLEHCLYRIEIAHVDSKDPHFKWSRFNGGLVGRGDVVYPDDTGGRSITITGNKSAITNCGTDSFYLEILEDKRPASGAPDVGHWCVTYGASAKLDGDVLKLEDPQFSREVPSGNVFFRLWDDIREIGEFSGTPDESQELQDGIRLGFSSFSGAVYRPGDYWTFQVRVGQAVMDPAYNHKPPDGITYHRVPLAEIVWADGGLPETIEDCRRRFPPLIHHRSCCQLTVGDGISSHGDYDSIQEAVEHLHRFLGGTICLLPGIHVASARIENRFNIRIKGCGLRTLVVPESPSDGDTQAPAFQVIDSSCIVLEQMALFAPAGTAIQIQGRITEAGENAAEAFRVLSSLHRIEIAHNIIVARDHAIHVIHGDNVRVHHNTIRMLDRPEGGVTIYLQAEDSVIAHNDIAVVPANVRPPGVTAGGEDDIGSICFNEPVRNENIQILVPWIQFLIMAVADFTGLPDRFQAKGGIQIGSGSERLEISENKIWGGAGNGITLGSDLDLESMLGQPTGEVLAVEVPPGINKVAFVREDGQPAVAHPMSIQHLDRSDLRLEMAGADGQVFLSESNTSYLIRSLDLSYQAVEMAVSPSDSEKAVVTIAPVAAEVDLSFLHFISDVSITRNQISNMGRSGIGTPQDNIIEIVKLLNTDRESTHASPAAGRLANNFSLLAVLALQFASVESYLVDCRVEGNHILQCLRITDEDLRNMLALNIRGEGGISLGFAENLVIRGNRIEANGSDHNNPVCGIFASFLAQGDIFHNQIINNGPIAPQAGINLQPGFRGGIVVAKSTSLLMASAIRFMAAAPLSANETNVEAILAFLGLVTAMMGAFALKVNENLIEQPVGQSLRIAAFGPLTITNNQLAVDVGIAPLAASVLIINLGRPAYRSTEGSDTEDGMEKHSNPLMPNGNILFCNNQTRLALDWSSLCSQLIATRDDLCFCNNQSDVLSENGKILKVNTVLLGYTARVIGNRMKEPIYRE